jgi:hypothetical protein
MSTSNFKYKGTDISNIIKCINNTKTTNGATGIQVNTVYSNKFNGINYSEINLINEVPNNLNYKYNGYDISKWCIATYIDVINATYNGTLPSWCNAIRGILVGSGGSGQAGNPVSLQSYTINVHQHLADQQSNDHYRPNQDRQIDQTRTDLNFLYGQVQQQAYVRNLNVNVDFQYNGQSHQSVHAVDVGGPGNNHNQHQHQNNQINANYDQGSTGLGGGGGGFIYISNLAVSNSASFNAESKSSASFSYQQDLNFTANSIGGPYPFGAACYFHSIAQNSIQEYTQSNPPSAVIANNPGGYQGSFTAIGGSTTNNSTGGQPGSNNVQGYQYFLNYGKGGNGGGPGQAGQSGTGAWVRIYYLT